MTTLDAPELVISRADGRDDGEDWTEDFQQLPGDAGISIILESTSQSAWTAAHPSASCVQTAL
jgi:hypothetical protein